MGAGPIDATGGPTQPTLLERFVDAIPGPYGVGCVLLGILVANPAVSLAVYLDLVNLDVLSAEIAPPLVGTWALVPYLILESAANAYLFLMARLMRQRVVRAEAGIAPLLPEGAPAFRRTFGGLAKPWPPVAITAILGGVLLPIMFADSSGPVWLLLAVAITYVVLYFALATVIWIYATVLWNIHRIGKGPLVLAPSDEDPMRGLRPLGALSLAVSSVYFAGVALAVSGTFLTGIIPGYLVFLAGLAVLGAVFFVLPLYSVHVRMAAAKRDDQAALRKRFHSLLAERDNPGHGGGDLPEVRDVLVDLKRAVTYDIVDRQVASQPTWPFDTRVVARLVAFATTIVLAIAIKVIIDYVLRL